jgi:hypothetical protein
MVCRGPQPGNTEDFTQIRLQNDLSPLTRSPTAILKACSNFNRSARVTRGARTVSEAKIARVFESKPTQWTCRKGFRMTNSRRLSRLGAAAPMPAQSPSHRFSATLVGWLIQTAMIAVVKQTCENLSESRGSHEVRRRLPAVQGLSRARLVFPRNFYQHALISKVWRRESKLSKAGHVVGERRRGRAVPG